MRKVRIFLPNSRPILDTNSRTLGELISELKENEYLDNDTTGTLIEKFQFMIPTKNGDDIDTELRSSSSELPNNDFTMFISIRAKNFGIIEEDIENILQKVDNVEEDVYEIKEKLDRILENLENSNTFSNTVPSSIYNLKETEEIFSTENNFEETYRKFNRI